MALKVSNIFVNLPVTDLQKSNHFFKGLGFEFNEQFTDEKAACLILGEQMYSMLLTNDFFQSFTEKQLPNTEQTSEVMVALSVDSREKVDEIVEKALDSGGKSSIPPTDHGFMYERGFEDLDGHIWSLTYMDMSAINN